MALELPHQVQQQLAWLLHKAQSFWNNWERKWKEKEEVAFRVRFYRIDLKEQLYLA